MKKYVLALLFAALNSPAGDFNPLVSTSGNSLYVYRATGGSSYDSMSFSTRETNRSLSGTGLSGTVVDAGDHWILDISGGSLNGQIYTKAGVEIRLNGNTVVLSNTKSGPAINGGGGVRISGPGVLRIDQTRDSAAIFSSGVVSVSDGAVVGINHLVESIAVSGKGIRILGSAVHVNTWGHAFRSESEGFEITGSIVSAVATGDGVQLRTHGPLQVSLSSVHFVSLRKTAIRSGDDSCTGGDAIAVSSSVFCAVGAEDGIQFHDSQGELGLDNVLGVVLGGGCGVSQVWKVFVDGGATKLLVAGNATGTHSPGEMDAVSLLKDNSGTGQAVYQAGTASLFRMDAGSVKLFAPGNTALSVATNVVAGGKLAVEAAPTWGDVQTLFTASGIVAAAETVAGGLAFNEDTLFADADLAQALATVVSQTAVLFDVGRGKAAVGLSQGDLFLLGGDVDVVASGTGISLGRSEWGYSYGREAFLRMTGGFASVVSDGVGLGDLGALDGNVSFHNRNSMVWMSGGRLSAKGGLDGVLTCGGFLMDGGTFEAAATGGHAAGTVSAKPGLVGYALSANGGFAIDGGSFLATKGGVRTAPTTSGSHGFAQVSPVDMSVSGAPENEPVRIGRFTPSWYGTNDLYPIQGKLRFWVPGGSASLEYGGKTYSLNAAKPSYRVKFSANGGKGKMSAQSFAYGVAKKLRANGFTRKGYVFDGWAKTKKGSVVYKNKASVKNLTAKGGTVVLYAKWAKKDYKVAFYANGGTGKMTAQKMTYGKSAKLKANKFKRKGYVFKGWAKTKALAKKGTVAYKNKKAVKNLVKNGQTVKLFATWVKKNYKVVFDANGGTGSMSAQTFTYGKAKALSANRFAKADCLFLGWALSKALADAGRVAYKDGQTVKNLVYNGKTLNLFAVWQSPALYLVVDLSGGSSSSSYPVSRLNAPPAGGFEADEYKTTKLVMRRIDPRTFTMGSPDDEESREDYREDQHRVTISHAFYIGVFELTQRQWELVMGTRPSYFSNPAYYAKRPVEQVSYDMIRGSSSGSGWPESSDVDASSFMGRLRARAAIGGDMVWDLPTEAQWEYACRAGTSGPWNSGSFDVYWSWSESASLDNVGRYRYNGGLDSDSSCTTDNGTAEVGSYDPNHWGLYDMHGNLFEWCLDWWQPHLGTAAVTDPRGPSCGLYDPYRMFRGGSWNDNAECCRSAFRGSCNVPSAVNKCIGFRVAVSRPR